MNIVKQIKQHLDTMTKTERQVASCCLSHTNRIAFCTLDELAGIADTSTTSVLRFCRRLGFEGFKQFQQAVRSEIHYHPDLPDKLQRTLDSGAGDALLSQTLQQSIHCIRQTFDALPHDQICRAVQLIADAGRVFTFGMRESFALAHYAYSRLASVRPEVHLLSAGLNGEPESILSLNRSDVCIVYLFHRYTKQSLTILELLHRQGVSVILVTSPPYEDVESLATVLLPCHVDANGIKNSSVAPVCLADYLCSAVAVVAGDDALLHMKRTEELFRATQLLDN